MKPIRLILICLFSTLASYAQFDIPSFKQVVTAFYSKYSFESYESYLKFQRKKEGWYVSQDHYANPGNYFNTLLFWSKETKSYKDIDYLTPKSDTSSVSANVNKYLKLIDWNYEEYQFKRNKYYGYPGWDWDVIIEDTGQKNVRDSILESDARAYSNYASGFIAEQYGDLFVNNDSDRTALKATDKISNSRIEKFISYELKAIDAYTKILNVNPYYLTKVGNIKIKRANEYMFMYSDLMMAGDSLSAKKFASKADYPDSLITLSKSYLRSLPLNSILVTGGDNDTYPLWYLQEFKNFRPDVIVLNYSLLGFRRYLSLIQQTYGYTLFSTQDTTYLRNNFDYFLFSNPKKDAQNTDVSVFLNDLTNSHNPYDTSYVYYKGEILKKYYSKNLFFRKDKIKKSAIININDYLYMNDYILLDIINTSTNRKIFFTFENRLVSPIAKQNGSVYEVEL